jgi:hypothetical protein
MEWTTRRGPAYQLLHKCHAGLLRALCPQPGLITLAPSGLYFCDCLTQHRTDEQPAVECRVLLDNLVGPQVTRQQLAVAPNCMRQQREYMMRHYLGDTSAFGKIKSALDAVSPSPVGPWPRACQKCLADLQAVLPFRNITRPPAQMVEVDVPVRLSPHETPKEPSPPKSCSISPFATSLRGADLPRPRSAQSRAEARLPPGRLADFACPIIRPDPTCGHPGTGPRRCPHPRFARVPGGQDAAPPPALPGTAVLNLTEVL